MYMALNRIAEKFADMYNASNDYIENLNLFNVTMRDGAADALKYADSVEKIMGINISEWISYQGKFKQLASGFGVVNEQADIMSKNLTQLSYDMASFFNVNQQKAFEKLSSAMSGQVKGLREFGIDTSIASLQEYALAKGIDLSVRKMTQAQKSVLRYNYILERSINIHGDLARTIQTPANAMRVLTAQIEQFRRAVGNIISVLVTKFIPYIQAAVMLLTDWANDIAGDLGFELPTIDYSNLDQAVSVTDDISDSMDDVTDSITEATAEAKKFKYQLMGFDELNILKSNNDDYNAKVPDIKDNVVNNYPSDLGLGVPEYDFGLDTVTPQAKGIYQKIKDYLENLTPAKLVEDILTFAWDTAIKGIGLLIEGLKGVWNWFTKLDTKSKLLVGTIAAIFTIAKVKKFIDWITKIFPSLNTGFQKLKDKFPNFFDGLKKAAFVAIGTIISAFAAQDFFYKLKTGALDTETAILDIGTAAAGIGMGFATGGWVGGAVAAVGTLIGALTGVEKAASEARKELNNEIFYNQTGTKITTLASRFTGVMDSIKNTYTEYNKTFDKLATENANVNSTVDNINKIKSAFDNGALSAEDACKRIKDALDGLPDQVKSNNNEFYNTVYDILYSPFGDALEQAGIAKTKINALLGNVVGDLNNKVDDIKMDISVLNSDYAKGKISESQYITQSAELANRLNDLALNTKSDTPTEVIQLETLMKDFPVQNINLENYDSYKGAFENVSKSTKAAKDAINAYYDNINSVFSALKSKAGTQEAKDKIQKAIDVASSTRNLKLNEINIKVNDFFKKVTLSASKSVNEAAKKYIDIWNNGKDPAAEAWYTTIATLHPSLGTAKEQYLRDRLRTYIEDNLGVLDSEITNALTQAGVGGKGFSKDIAISLGRELVNNYSEAYATSFFDGFTDKELEEKTNAWFRDLAKENGLSYTESWGNDVNLDPTIREKTSSFGNLWWARGVTDRDMYINSFKTESERTIAGVGFNIANSFSTAFQNALNLAIPNDKLPKLQAVGTTIAAAGAGIFNNALAQIQFRQYASGGFPEMGEMFIARENGAELVGTINGKTAVANNEQITEGIARAVYSAMMSAGSANGGTIRIENVMELDGEVIGRKSVEYHNNEVIRTGASPLTI